MKKMIEKKIVRMLADADTPLRSSEIAKRLEASKPTVVSHLNRLKEKGKVEQVLYQNTLSWQPSPEWSDVLQRAKRLEQRLKAMYGKNKFDPAEAQDRLKEEFKPAEFNALLELIPNLKSPVPELKVTRRVGCTPTEEFEYQQERRESTVGKTGFDVFKRAAGSVRPVYIAASPLSEEDKAKETWKWYKDDGYYREVNFMGGMTPVWVVLGTIGANELRKLLSGNPDQSQR